MFVEAAKSSWTPWSKLKVMMGENLTAELAKQLLYDSRWV